MIPNKIDRYQIIETLGQGGFGVVYLAHEPRLKRKVAIKLLREDPANLPNSSDSLTPKTARERFEAEAQTLVKLDFDGVVRIYDYGEYDGRPYLVMQYMPGGTLAERINGEPLSLPDTAVILTRLCTTLDKVHQRNTIHRDLKPLNILFDADGEAYLSDFGIARLAENTNSTIGIGTPRYMAPEQFMEDPLTVQTDIYQMGVILFEMLTGKSPFDASTGAAVIQKVLHNPTPSVSELNPDLDPAFDEIIQIVLAKNPQDRYRNAKDLAAHFAALAHNTPVPAGMPALPPPVVAAAEPVHPQKQSRRPMLLAALLLIPFLFLAGMVLWRILPSPVASSAPVGTAVSATGEPGFTIILVTATGQAPDPAVVIENEQQMEPTIDAQATTTAEAVLAETQKLQATQTSLAINLTATASSRPTNTPRPLPTIAAISSPDVSAEYVAIPPVINGDLSDWPAIQAVRSEHVVAQQESWDGTQDLVVAWQLAWDDRYLYLGVTAVDDTHVQTQTGNQIFKGDSVSMQIDTDLAGDLSDEVSPDDFQIDFSPGDFASIPPSVHRFQGHDGNWLGDAPGHSIRVQARQTANGYTLEAAIPWDDLNWRPINGEQLGLALNATDNDTPDTAVQELFISNVPGRRLNVPNSWGTLTLQGQPVAAAISPPQATNTNNASNFMIEDFDYPDDDALANAYWINSPGDQVEMHLAGVPNTFSGQKALAVTYRLNPDTGDYLGIERNLTTPMDWRDYSQVCFWLDDISFEGFLIFQFKEQNSESWKYRAPITPPTRGEICLELNDQVFEISSRRLNNIMDLDAVDNYAFYFGEGGNTEGTVYIDALQLRP